MSAKVLTDLSQLCVHTITTKPWPIEQAATEFAASGVKGITVWRDALEGRNVAQQDREPRPRVAMTMLGNTTRAVMTMRDVLATHGLDTVVFHSNGNLQYLP